MDINTEIKDLSIAAVREWLLNYAWLGTEDEQRREVDCIMSSGDIVSIVDGLTEKYAGMAFDEAQAMEAQGYALSCLYECHDGPHLTTCPRYKDNGRCDRLSKAGTGIGMCNLPLDENGYCDNPRDHIES